MEQNQLVTIEPKSALSVFTEDKAIDIYLEKIKGEIDKFEGDVSTPKGRKDIASMAYKIAQTKTYIEGVGKELADDVKKIPKKIDDTRKRVRETLDGWRDQVRKPLTDWETAEETRVKGHEASIAGIHALTALADETGKAHTAAHLKECLAKVEAVVVDSSLLEFEAQYARAKADATSFLTASIAEREKYEADQAELERLRKAEAERTERERIEAIQREAADKARREAEEKAEAERKAAEQAAEAERQRVENERKAEQEAAAKRERDLLAEKEAAEKRAADAKAAAEREAEETRQREAAETRRREEDREHRAKINNAAVAALVAGGIAEDTAKAVVVLIASKSVPSVTINY